MSLALLTVSFVVACLATGALIPLLRQARCLDVPTARSSHDRPTPRGGGLGILAGIAAGLLLAHCLGYDIPSPVVLIAAASVALVGLVDDFRGGVSPLARLLVQVAAAAAVCLGGGVLQSLPLPTPLDLALGWLGGPLTLLWIVGVTNYFNFLDGIDGYAATQASLAGLAMASLGGDDTGALVGCCMAGACFGFLMHNWRPAKVFMGDVGSTTLGFLLAALPLQHEGDQRSQWVFAVAVFLWFFLADGLFTMLRRTLQGESVWTPHRSHLYQVLVQSGLRHDQVVVRVMSIAALLCVGAVMAQRWDADAGRWFVLVLAMLAFLGYLTWTSLRQRLHAVALETHLPNTADSFKGNP